ncbi:MAG TPA: hypothetical protein VE714_10040 [Gemmatimonadales bacterium]|nr:hypothetical protein [Gemmatimonadales bacterium]
MGWGLYPVVRICVLLVQLPTLGSDAEDRLRLAQLLGTAPAETFLLRSLSTSLGSMRQGVRTSTLTDVLIVHNSAVPFSLNDGGLWAARGASALVRAGVRAEWRRVTLVIAPELVTSENLAYAMPPPAVELPRPAGRNPYSTPWHVGAYSIDLPLRFGAKSFARVDPGQSTLALRVGGMSVGLSTENEWWGPGIRNAIVLSDNAPGIWRAFARNARPWRTGIGTFSARWFLGGLFESAYFDSTRADDRRAITGVAATWTPPGVPHLTFGAARTVYAPIDAWRDVVDHVLDVVRGRGMHRAPSDSVARPSRDQMFSLFSRWIFPADGFAVHAEWARNQLPGSLRELLVSPDHSEGYTLGLEWARPLRDGAAIRTQVEVTYLEKSPAYRNLPTETWYTGGAAPQGYTQRGQVIGAAIGPGASSQWLAGDYIAPRWRAGLFGGRIRWDNDALYLFSSTTEKRCAHDVSLFGGVRGAGGTRWGHVDASLTLGRRFNMFYAAASCDTPSAGNTTLELRFTP